MGLGITGLAIVIAIGLMFSGMKDKTGSGCLSFLIVSFLIAVVVLKLLF